MEHCPNLGDSHKVSIYFHTNLVMRKPGNKPGVNWANYTIPTGTDFEYTHTSTSQW